MGLEEGRPAHKFQDQPGQTTTGSTPITTSPPILEEPINIFRCAPMSLLQLYIPAEAAPATIAELGSIELVQFRDVNLVSFIFLCVV